MTTSSTPVRTAPASNGGSGAPRPRWLPATHGQVKCARCRVRVDDTADDRAGHDRWHVDVAHHLHEVAE